MGKEYELEKILKRLELNRDNTAAALTAWKQVEIVTKKDGTPFKNPAQNFLHADYTYSTISGKTHPSLVVKYCYGSHGWGSDAIDCYISAKDLKKDDPRQNKIIDCGIFEDVYIYTVEEIPELIAAKIKRLETRLESYEKQITAAVVLFEEVYKTVSSAFEKLEQDCIEYKVNGMPATLEHAIKDAIKNIF